MLAMKTLIAASRFGLADAPDRAPGAAAPGLVFDEIDAGIGGRVADEVGRHLRQLGSAFQVLCITHLPQIAAAADAHYQIEKHVEGGRTVTRVRRLSDTERVEEIGRMLAGHAITDAVRASAREMIESRRGDVATVRADRAEAKGEPSSKGESERSKAKRARAPR
jgi:DNA repair protein RecN (Recombination protein N)